MTASIVDITTLQHLHLVLGDELLLSEDNDPADACALIRDLLTLMPLPKDDHRRQAQDLIGPTGAASVVRGALTGAGLIEHRGGENGPWITPKGRWLAATLNRIADLSELAGQVKTAGLPHWTPRTAELPCTQACWRLPPSWR